MIRKTLQLLNFFLQPPLAGEGSSDCHGGADAADCHLHLARETTHPLRTLADLARHFCGDGGGVWAWPHAFGVGNYLSLFWQGALWVLFGVNGSVAADFCASGSSPGR